MTDLPRPIPESYWVMPGKLLAGEYPGRFDMEKSRKRIDAFIDAGFNTFIDLTSPNESDAYHRILREQSDVYGHPVQYLNYPITDFGLPTVEHMNEILNAIEAALNEGRKIYVHCWAGIGRTGTTVGCLLVRQGMAGEEALRHLADLWKNVPKSSIHRQSPETVEQMMFIRDWPNHDQGPSTGS